MIRPLIAALALVLALSLPASAHPNYPGLGARGDSIEVPARAGAGKVKKAVSESRTGHSALAIARRYIGTNPTGMRRLWCQAFVNFVERKAGRRGTGSNLALSSAKYGKRVPIRAAQPGDIVVTDRPGPGAHVGYLVEPIRGKTARIISGNSGGRGPGRRVVAEGNYPVSKIIAVVRPS